MREHWIYRMLAAMKSWVCILLLHFAYKIVIVLNYTKWRICASFNRRNVISWEYLWVRWGPSKRGRSLWGLTVLLVEERNIGAGSLPRKLGAWYWGHEHEKWVGGFQWRRQSKFPPSANRRGYVRNRGEV